VIRSGFPVRKKPINFHRLSPTPISSVGLKSVHHIGGERKGYRTITCIFYQITKKDKIPPESDSNL
jgi:hypothetical protein